jgi:hypothetical protein
VIQKTSAILLLCGVLFTGISGLHAQEKKGTLELMPLKAGASLYFGQMFNINDTLQDIGDFNPTLTLPTTSLWMVQEAIANERLHFALGIAGTFWYPFPESKFQGYTSYRTGGVAISQANGTYAVGDLESPWLQISVGLQGYKYNPYAKNFGEYLFRAEAYPTTVRTGDWGAIDNAGAGIWGAAFKGTFLDGKLHNDFLVTMSTERAPLHDVSFTNITRADLGGGFQIGGGVTLSRYLQIDPRKSKPPYNSTGWFTWTAEDQAWMDTSSGAAGITRTTVSGTEPDTALVVGQEYWAASQRPLVLYALNYRKQADVEYVDSKTILLMGQASFDPKKLLGLENLLNPSDLVLYGEISVLGLDNYPVYYRSLSERIPMMAGFYLPTFRYLDFLTVEVEYFRNPHMNSDAIVGLSRELRPKAPNGVQPEVPDIADPYYDGLTPDTYLTYHHDDDFKWTVTALKSFGVWSIAGQAGRDHFRPLTGFFRPSYTEAATTSDAWYYMIRFMVNI